jgi:hypothetical protein
MSAHVPGLMAAAARRMQSGATLADVEGIPEVEAVFLARPGDLFVSGGGNVAALDDLVAEWRSTDGNTVLTATNGTTIRWKDDGAVDRVKFSGDGHLELDPTPDTWKPPMLMASAFIPDPSLGTTPACLADSTIDDYYTRIYAQPGLPLVGVETRIEGSNIYHSGDEGAFDSSERVVVATFDGGAATARVDGVDYAPTADLYSGITSDIFSIGGLSDSTPTTANGAVVAVVMAVGVPSAADQTTIEQWLAGLVEVNL